MLISDADPNIRDHSGKRPTQYLVNTSQAKTRNNNSSDSVQRKMIEHLGGGLSQGESFTTPRTYPVTKNFSSLLRTNAIHQSMLNKKHAIRKNFV